MDVTDAVVICNAANVMFAEVIVDSFEELKTADNATQAQMIMYSKLFKINFTKMDPYEFKTFTDILQRYSALCKPIKGNGRGKKKK